jgi:hypothetical protein
MGHAARTVIICLAVVVLAGLAAPARAQEPEPTPAFNFPYEFGAVDYDKNSNLSGTIGLKGLIKDFSFFNDIFAYVLTSWEILIEDHSTGGAGNNIIAVAVYFSIATLVTKWVANRFVFKKGSPIEPIEMSEADIADASFDGIEYMTKKESSAWSRFGTYLNKRGKYY